MSYPGVDPSDTITAEPVGTQAVSEGETKQLDGEELKKVVEEAVANQFAITDGWKTPEKIEFVVLCPSGQRALVRRLGTMDLLEAGLIEDMDFFTKALLPAGFDQAGNPVDSTEQPSFWKALKDPKRRLQFIQLLNRLLEVAVVNPKVIDDGAGIVDNGGKDVVVLGTSIVRENGIEYLRRADGSLRPFAENEVKASAIDFTDKMAIFGELNRPLEEIKPFREAPNGVASVDTVQGSESPSQ